MLHIKLGDKTRKAVFGNYVFKKIEQERGIGLLGISDALSTVSIDVISDMLYHALRCAEIADGEPAGDYTPDHVAAWMDSNPNSLAETLKAVTDSVTAMTKSMGDDDGAKKKK